MANIANISAFKANLSGGGVRNNQFAVTLSFPNAASNGFTALAPLKGQFMIHAASLPESHVDPTLVPYRGREVFLAGERKFQPWTCSFYNDSDHTIKNALETWSQLMNNNSNNTGLVNPSDYVADITIEQMSRNNEVVKSYKLIDAWPIDISAVQLSFSDNNTIQSISCTFAYQYYETNTTSGGLGLGVSVNTPIGNFPVL